MCENKKLVAETYQFSKVNVYFLKDELGKNSSYMTHQVEVARVKRRTAYLIRVGTSDIAKGHGPRKSHCQLRIPPRDNEFRVENRSSVHLRSAWVCVSGVHLRSCCPNSPH